VKAANFSIKSLRISENNMLLILAVSVGIATASSVYLFRQGIDFFTRVFRDGLSEGLLHGLGPWAFIPILALGGAIAGIIKSRYVGEERIHGVAGIMESVAYSGGRLPYQKMPFKAFLAAFSLGAGASTGPEDPSVQIGANLGGFFGQRLRLSDDRVRLLVAAGAAGGIAAAFRAPIAGVFFALEIILGDFSTGSFGVVVLASVVSSVLTRVFEVGGPELGIRAYSMGGPGEIPLYVLLGLLCAPIAAAFLRIVDWQNNLWHRIHIPAPLKTTIAGALVGLIAVAFPQVLGIGRETLNLVLNQSDVSLTVGLLLALIAAKMFATSISLGGGFIGGVFAPALFAGAVFGRAFGQIAVQIFPGTADPAAFAMAGMAAVMTGVIRSPITAVLLLFELTNDYNLILPIMLVVAVCLFVVERFAPDGLYHHGLAKHGIRLARGRDIDLMQTVMVRDAMAAPNTVPASLPVEALDEEFDKKQTHGLIVVDASGALFGIVTLQDLARARESEAGFDKLTVADICTRDVITITPSDSIAEALHLISARDLGRVPVVDDDNPRKVLGLLRRRDIMRAYDMALERKQAEQRRTGSIRLATISGAHIIELRLESKSPADHHLVRDIQWPEGSVIASVSRRGQSFAPNGSTLLLAGDTLTIHHAR